MKWGNTPLWYLFFEGLQKAKQIVHLQYFCNTLVAKSKVGFQHRIMATNAVDFDLPK